MKGGNCSVLTDQSGNSLGLQERLHRALAFNDEYYKDEGSHEIPEMGRKEREQLIDYDIRFVNIN